MTTKPVAAASAGKKRKLVNVVLLNGDQHVVHVDVKSKFQEVFNQVAGHLSLRETEYFGLAFKKDNEYNFILLDEKIHKLAPKQWKSGNGEGVDSEGKPLITVWFRVQFYVDQVILLREKVTRHQYYLQLKDNVLQYNHLYNEEKCFQLAGYALQADHGNYLPERHEMGYFNPILYFPYWMVERHGATYLASNMPTIHKDLHNMTRNDAELRYIRNASTPPGAHNLHFYTVRKRKTDKAVNTWLAICAKGVEVYEDDAGYKNHISTFLWRDIGKLYFDKKKFEIRSIQSAGGRRFIYYTDCDIKSKYLLSICRGTHMFQMAIQPKLLEIQHLDNEDQKRYRESYVYSDSRDRSHFQHSPSKSLSATGLSSNQRFSVISDASSNTTSGIVSDRMAVSFDDGDDHSREIMIDCPPRAVLSNTPSQIKSKFQLFSGFKQSPQSNKTSPSQIPHCLELGKSENINPSPQELSPTSSNGSWRARHSQTPVYLIGATGPTQTTPTNDSHSYTGLRRSGGRKDSFSKLLQGSLLSSGDRNTSGDSAVSVSGILTGPDKLAPLSLPPSEHWALTGPVTQGTAGKSGVGASGSPSFALTPSSVQKTSGPSPPSTLNFSSLKSTKETGTTVYNKDTTEQYKIIGTQREISSQYKQLNPPPDYNEKYKSLSSPRANISEHYGNAKSFGSPRTLTEQQFKVQSTDVYKTLGSPRDVAHDVFKLPLAHRAPPEYKPTVSSPRADIYSTQTTQVLQPEIHTNELLLDAQPTKDSHNPSLSQPVQGARRGATEHYLLALQQGAVHLMEQQAKGEQKTPLNSLAQLQEHYQNISSHHQQAQEQQPPEYHLFNAKPKEVLSNQPSTEASMTQEMEENKENLCNKDMEMKEKVEDSVGTQPGHNKGSLHPELKQILGQSHAISLPLITALCNDSSLMQTSRSQSGSRSSYDTSTVRSTDSRLTRLSHETDPRRWSSCCQAAGMPDMMLSVQSARPYSWHSEHFELDTQLALPATDHLTQITPPNPRAVNNKHLKILDSQNSLPQKMIESDPGPSSPRIISRYDGTSWWDTPMYTANINSSSWTEVIPYNLPAHHPPSKHTNSSSQHHQHMVPHKLSSGGHRDSDTSIAHKQMMKENIGIA
ncbi:protein expanded-like isoform X2 [Physella acuta]|uniref:protein expanded-like isoform X2 n=1 Tax=Physella acuta TaxID=109671 RepID=UPI0027DBD8D9|nr:protein expanded-like isoform X2 [Physella acuta]